MEPLRQGGTQRTLIWEEKDFSSKLWEITTLLRMTQLLHDRAEQLWSPLRVPGRALVETCPVSAPWRDLSLEGAAAEDQTRGPRAEASAVKQVPLSSLQSRPAECGCEPAVPEPATQV